MGGPPRNFYSQNSRPARKSSAVQLSHASLIGTQEILQQQHALEEHGTVQFQPRTACKRHTVAQAARPAAEPCLDDARIKQHSRALQHRGQHHQPKQISGITRNSSTAATTTKLQSTIAVPLGWTDPRLHAALFCSPFARPLEPDHETGLKRRSAAARTWPWPRPRRTERRPYLFWSLVFCYAVDPPTL